MNNAVRVERFKFSEEIRQKNVFELDLENPYYNWTGWSFPIRKIQNS